MLKFRNFILLFFGVAFLSIFLFIHASQSSSSSNSRVLAEERGRVLGVSEKNTEIKKTKNYLALDKLEKIIPVVDKSKFKPLRKEGTKNPDLLWGSILAKDLDSGEDLYAWKKDRKRPIASITKLMTALVLMDLKLDWNSFYKIKKTDRVEGGRIYIRQGEKIKLRDLLYVSLVASANTATKSLVSASGLSYTEFVEEMNKKAEDLGLLHTHFVDPIGLSSLDVSTAEEVSKLAQTALSNGVIRDCVTREKYVFSSANGNSKTIRSTDILLDNFQGKDIKILGGKTGFTGAAGYCFVAMFEGAHNNKVITVVLGAKNHHDRFSYTKKLVNWVYSSYEWRR